MASIVTIRPNALAYLGTGYWFKYPGSNAITSADWSLLQDNDDNSHFYGIMSNVDEFHLHFGSYTLAANQRCARARLGHRIGGKSDTFPMSMDTWMAVPGYLGDGSSANHTGVIAQWTQLWNAWHESEFVQGAIDAIQGRYRKLDNTTTPAVSESYVELDIRTQPTVSITGPAAGSIVYTRRPTVTWSYNAQGDAVRAHQVKVFSAAQVAAGGFNPDSSAATWDSGRVSGAATSKQVGIDLARGTTYYFYVKLASDFRAADWWSNWANRSVVINTLPVASAVTVDPPTPITTTNKPTIGWTYSDANNDAQNQYWVRVYSEAVYGASGFNEGDVASAAWSSGAVASSTARSVQTGALSPNVNYKAFVWVNDPEAVWSASAQSGVFVIQTAPGTMADPPAAPEVVSATADDTNQRVVVAVEGRDNLLTRNQSTIDTGTIGWEADTNISSLTRDTTTFLQGGGALRFVATAAGNTKVRTVGNQQLPVGPNRTFTALASMRAAGATARTAQTLINWHNAGGGYLSTTVGATQTINNAGWTQVVATAAAPADAAYAQLILEVTDAAAGEAFLADNISFAPGTSTTWQRGGFVAEAGTLIDTFDRADSATTLGTADQGGAWAVYQGTWGITGNRAYLATSTDSSQNMAALSSTHVADGYVEADVTLSSVRASVGLVFRYLDGNDHLMVRFLRNATFDRLDLYKRDAAVYTALVSVDGMGLVLGQTYRLRVEFYGGQVNIYLDGDLRISHLLLAGEHTKFGAYGGYGLYLGFHSTSDAWDNGGSRWDNFRAALDPTQLVTVERSLDDGTTWYPLRGAVRYDLGPTQLGTFYDYEVSAGQLAQYRATAFASEAGDEYDTTGATLTQDVALVIDRWWLKDAVDPSLNMTITVAPPFQFRRKEPMQAYDPMGRQESVFVSDGAKGVEGQLNIWCKDKATWDKLQALLGNGRALLLQNPLGHNWWVKFGDQDYQLVRAQSDAGDGTPVRHFHAVALPFVQVSAPAVV